MDKTNTIVIYFAQYLIEIDLSTKQKEIFFSLRKPEFSDLKNYYNYYLIHFTLSSTTTSLLYEPTSILS